MSSSSRRGSPALARRVAPLVMAGLIAVSIGADDSPPPQQTHGPSRGTLVIAGGGASRGTGIYERFVQLAGGPEARIVVVPTASWGDDAREPDQSGTAQRFKQMGAASVHVLHTTDRATADTEAFARPIAGATAVWFDGGKQWRLAAAYGGTRTERACHDLLQRGGVVGGTSAGASIQSSFLITGDPTGKGQVIGRYQRGFGFIRHAAIDQHVVERGRQGRLVEVITDHDERMDPELNGRDMLGIGIDAGTAIVVHGDTFEVIGRRNGAVLVYDPRTWPGLPADAPRYTTLTPGSRYDMRERRQLPRQSPREADGATEP